MRFLIVFLGLLLPVWASAATVEQSKTAQDLTGSSSSLTFDFDSSPTEGNDVLVVVYSDSQSVNGATFDTDAMTEDFSTQFTLIKFYRLAVGASAGTQVVVTLAGNSNVRAIALEVSGLASASTLDDTSAYDVTGEGSSTSHSEEVTTSEGGEFGLVIAAQGNNRTATGSGSAVALPVGATSFPTTVYLIYEDGLASGSTSIDWTLSLADSPSAASVTYRTEAASSAVIPVLHHQLRNQ